MKTANNQSEVAKHFGVKVAEVRAWKNQGCPALLKGPYVLDAISAWLKSKEDVSDPSSRGLDVEEAAPQPSKNNARRILAIVAVIPVLISSAVGILAVYKGLVSDGPSLQIESQYEPISIPPDLIDRIDKLRNEYSYDRYRSFVESLDKSKSQNPSFEGFGAMISSQEIDAILRKSEGGNEGETTTFGREQVVSAILAAVAADRAAITPRINATIDEAVEVRSSSIYRELLRKPWDEFSVSDYTDRKTHLVAKVKNSGNSSAANSRLNWSGSGVATLKRSGKDEKVLPFVDVIELGDIRVEEEIEIQIWNTSWFSPILDGASISYDGGIERTQVPARVTGFLSLLAFVWPGIKFMGLVFSAMLTLAGVVLVGGWLLAATK